MGKDVAMRVAVLCIRPTGGRTWWAHFKFTRPFGTARRAAESAASFKLRRICREQVESPYSNETTNSRRFAPGQGFVYKL